MQTVALPYTIKNQKNYRKLMVGYFTDLVTVWFILLILIQVFQWQIPSLAHPIIVTGLHLATKIRNIFFKQMTITGNTLSITYSRDLRTKTITAPIAQLECHLNIESRYLFQRKRYFLKLLCNGELFYELEEEDNITQEQLVEIRNIFSSVKGAG
ncbi:MAG: hypothetical protein JNL72_00075 [Flavipsychrobacter sp.]|nr:hypothetical protein [Flavipsychrobacter sp.]